jgi:glycosyltransferase involved in cell wall biosynthesis
VTFRHSKSWAANDTIDGVPVIRVAGVFLGKRERLPRILQKALYFAALVSMGFALWRYRHHYDVLHVYSLNLIAIPAALACYLSGKPMVVAVRSAYSGRKRRPLHQISVDDAAEATNNPIPDVYGQSRVQGDLEDMQRLGKPVMRFTRFLLQRIEAELVILSTRMREYLISHDFTFPDACMEGEHADSPCHRPLLIPNGVDTARFFPLGGGVSHSRTVVCTARLGYEKGIDVLLHAWHLVHKKMPNARLIIAGTGPLHSQLLNLAEALELGESVEFAGLQRDVPAVLHRASVATLPSRWEGMPNAVLEAMACGLPCVATRVSGTEDIITHEVNGLLVEPEDPQALAQALMSLLGDPARCAAYGKAARRRIEDDYALEHVTDMYMGLYERMASAKSSEPVSYRRGLRTAIHRNQGRPRVRPDGSDETSVTVVGEGSNRCAE